MILEPRLGNSIGNLASRRKSVITLTKSQGKAGRRPSCYDLPTFTRQQSINSSQYDSQFLSTSSLGVPVFPGQSKFDMTGAMTGAGGMKDRRASETQVR